MRKRKCRNGRFGCSGRTFLQVKNRAVEKRKEMEAEEAGDEVSTVELSREVGWSNR